MKACQSRLLDLQKNNNSMRRALLRAFKNRSGFSIKMSDTRIRKIPRNEVKELSQLDEEYVNSSPARTVIGETSR